ncbi:MAG: adenine deaminase [Bacteroidota bacterium]
MKVEGRLVDIHNRRIFNAEITVKGGIIGAIEKSDIRTNKIILPGLIDSHVHIESSMLTPGNFAMACVPHGTIGVVSDPHEIANVMGIKGVAYMIKESERVPVKFWFGAPSCVPATRFETNGEKIGPEEVRKLLKKIKIKYLAEMMNFPGVINGDKEILEKINAAKEAGKKIDGHAPGLSGEGLRKYAEAGISTDHECSTIDEAREKIYYGMKILIREGSAARNIEALEDLYNTDPSELMLCSDDLHPEMLQKGHINKLIARLINEGYDRYDVIRSATLNPVEHYGLEAGLMRVGDIADFIIVDSLEKMNVLETWISGKKVFGNGRVLFGFNPGDPVNVFNCNPVSVQEIKIKNLNGKFRIIQAYDGKLLTVEETGGPVSGENVEPVPGEDLLKIVVKDRYHDAPPAVAFIKGFNLKEGAFASSVAHDSHNIIAIGTNDDDIVTAINEIVKLKGGLSVSNASATDSLKLDVAGIMSSKPCGEVASRYEFLSNRVKSFGCTMAAPFMTLSFMALLVIPELKLSDRGLFDGRQFCHVPLFV